MTVLLIKNQNTNKIIPITRYIWKTQCKTRDQLQKLVTEENTDMLRQCKHIHFLISKRPVTNPDGEEVSKTQSCPNYSSFSNNENNTKWLTAELSRPHNSHLSGDLLLPLSLNSELRSCVSVGECETSNNMCSFWERYCWGVCFASRAQCTSSRCNNGRFAWFDETNDRNEQ